jgi:hypothetical protein
MALTLTGLPLDSGVETSYVVQAKQQRGSFVRFLLVVVAALVFTGSALADTTFTDATGENAAAADISTTVVSNDPAAHTFKLAVQITNMPTLEPNSEIDILFDSDKNASTGQQGFDYLFGIDPGGWGFFKWDGTQYADVPSVTSLDVQYVNGLMTVVFHESDMGITGGFNFGVLTFRGPDPANPVTDGAGLYPYTLTTPAPPVVKAPTVKGTTVTATVPKAGGKFHVGPFQVNLSDGTAVTATGVKCTATVGGVKLKGTGPGGCTFALPKKAKKKKLVVKVSGVYAGATISRTVTYVVK